MDEKIEVIQEEQPKALPMKWYKFRVEFCMILGGIMFIVLGAVAASTVMYSFMAQLAGIEYNDSIVYDGSSGFNGDVGFIPYFYTANKAFDIAVGIIFILLGIATFYVRSRMKKFTADALKKFYILIIAEHALFSIYDFVFAFITKTELDIIGTVVVGLATSVVFVVLEIYYFNKRKALFVN